MTKIDWHSKKVRVRIVLVYMVLSVASVQMLLDFDGWSWQGLLIMALSLLTIWIGYWSGKHGVLDK